MSKFVYLGGTVTQEGGSAEDIKSRLGKARAAFNKLRNIWKSSQLKLRTKLKIFKSNVVAVLLYGCETYLNNTCRYPSIFFESVVLYFEFLIKDYTTVKCNSLSIFFTGEDTPYMYELNIRTTCI